MIEIYGLLESIKTIKTKKNDTMAFLKISDETGYFDEKLLRHQDLQLLIQFTHKYKLYQVDEFLHCCDVSDVQNRPNGDKAVEYKKLFFHSVNPIFQTMTKKEQIEEHGVELVCKEVEE